MWGLQQQIAVIVLHPSVVNDINDDVIEWKYFPRYWPFVRGIHRSPGHYQYKMLYLMIVWYHQEWARTSLSHWPLGDFNKILEKNIFKLIIVTDGYDISSEIAPRWTSLDLNVDKSTLVQVMAWCRQAASHYLSQCWPRSLSPYGVIGSQWVKPDFAKVNFHPARVLTCTLAILIIKMQNGWTSLAWLNIIICRLYRTIFQPCPL